MLVDTVFGIIKPYLFATVIATLIYFVIKYILKQPAVQIYREELEKEARETMFQDKMRRYNLANPVDPAPERRLHFQLNPFDELRPLVKAASESSIAPIKPVPVMKNMEDESKVKNNKDLDYFWMARDDVSTFTNSLPDDMDNMDYPEELELKASPKIANFLYGPPSKNKGNTELDILARELLGLLGKREPLARPTRHGRMGRQVHNPANTNINNEAVVIGDHFAFD